MSSALPVRTLSLAAALTLAATVARAQSAQTAPAAQPKHPAVCAKGVRIYTELSQVPVPHDTLQMPPSEPVRVTSEQEAEAAELAMRGRAGSVGATGILVTDKVVDLSDGER